MSCPKCENPFYDILMERFYKREGIETCNCKEEEEELMTCCVCERTDIPRKIIKNKSNRKSKKIIFVIEGEFDITKMSELPDHIVHYCISFLATEETGYYFERNYPLPKSRLHCELTEDEQRIVSDWRHNRPSKWFDRLLRSETELLWNTKYVPMLTKAFTKMPKAQIHHLTRMNIRWIYYDKLHSRASWIKKKLDFDYFKGDYRLECIETILLSKGLSYPRYYDGKNSLYLEPYNPENFVAKLRFK